MYPPEAPITVPKPRRILPESKPPRLPQNPALLVLLKRIKNTNTFATTPCIASSMAALRIVNPFAAAATTARFASRLATGSDKNRGYPSSTARTRTRVIGTVATEGNSGPSGYGGAPMSLLRKKDQIAPSRFLL